MADIVPNCLADILDSSSTDDSWIMFNQIYEKIATILIHITLFYIIHI